MKPKGILRDLARRPVRLSRRGLMSGAVLVLIAIGLVSLGPRVWKALFRNEDARFLDLIREPEGSRAALAEIQTAWQPADAIKLVETLTWVEHGDVKQAAFAWLEETTGQSFGLNHNQWYDWIVSVTPGPPPRYAWFKAALYGRWDPELGEYFRNDPPATIRLDEVRWAGVRRDGIPPLREPKVVPAGGADYLEPDSLVFGVEVNGEARAYPRRIVIHHELVTDVVGGEPITAVYCTLCNLMVVYRSIADGRHYTLGTSGFVYRSNKLMYDRDTRSLWSAFLGRPVVGPLAAQPIVLGPLPVVTTTWQEWRRRHPETRVLSPDTGFPRYDGGEPRDYSEASSHRPYFANDRPIFPAGKLDDRLRNMDEVFVLRGPETEFAPVAIAVPFLAGHPVCHTDVGGRAVVVLTDAGGANRAFETGGRTFTAGPGQDEVTDKEQRTWQVREDGLRSADGTVLRRVPAHRAFWFGWHAAHPETRLIQ